MSRGADLAGQLDGLANFIERALDSHLRGTSMRTHPFVLFLMINAIASISAYSCHSSSKDSHSGLLGSGIIDGNGDDKLSLEQVPLPNLNAVKQALVKLAIVEPTLAELMSKGAFNNEITFVKANDRCYLSSAPKFEIRAFFNHDTKMMGFCRKFFEISSNEQIFTILHELTHYVVWKTQTNFPSGEEDVVRLIESAMRNYFNAPRFEVAVTSAMSLRALIDKYIPRLILFLYPKSVIGDYVSIRVFKDQDIATTYPVPKQFHELQYIPPHLLEDALARMWSPRQDYRTLSISDPFLMNKMVSVPFQEITEVQERQGFVYWYKPMNSDVIERDVLLPRIKLKMGHTESPVLNGRIISRDVLSPEFLKFIDAAEAKMGVKSIRTMGYQYRSVGSGCMNSSCWSDFVFFFE